MRVGVVLFLICSGAARGIELGFALSPDHKLEPLINLSSSPRFHQAGASVLTLGEVRPERVDLSIGRKDKVYAGYDQLFGAVETCSLTREDGKRIRLRAFRYPDPSAPAIGMDEGGGIWAVEDRRTIRLLGHWAMRSVVDAQGRKEVRRMHRLEGETDWLCVLDGRVCREDEHGVLRTLGYVAWERLNQEKGGGRLSFPLVRSIGFPSAWEGYRDGQTWVCPAGTWDHLAQRAISSADLDDLKSLQEADAQALIRLDQAGETSLLMRLLNRTTASDAGPVLEFLVEKGCSVTRPDPSGRTPLHKAAGFDQPAFVSLLLEHGAGVNQADKAGRTPLHDAAMGRLYLNGLGGMVGSINPMVLKALLDAGADVKAVDKRGRTPLHDAATFLQLYTAETLLKAGADPNAQDQEGNTPGICAVKGWEIGDADQRSTHFFRNEDMVHLLAHYGCQWKIANRKGQTYLSLFLEDPHGDENRIPESLRGKRDQLATYADFSAMEYLVAGSSWQDMAALFGEPHQFREQDCFIGDRVVSCVVFWYWSDRRWYKFYFRDLRVVRPADSMTFKFAQANNPDGVQVKLENTDRKLRFVGGVLVQFRSNASVRTRPPQLTQGLKVTQLGLFASGEEELPAEKRVYSDRFSGSELCYLNWHLNLFHPGLKESRVFVLHADFMREGTLFVSGFQKTRVEQSWPDSFHIYGWGQKTPGFWPKGRYTLVLSAGGEKLAEKAFTVE